MIFDQFENKHQGERCFILGNAPSLKEEDLSLLKNETVFICNKGYNALTIGLDHYDYYVLADPGVAIINREEIEKNIKCPRFISSVVTKKKNFQKIYKKPFVQFKRNSKAHFKQFPNRFADGWDRVLTVVLDATIIAYFMGFSKIYLLGVELDYSSNNTHFYPDDDREIKHKDDIPRQLDIILENFLLIRNHFNNKKIEFINCSTNWKHTNILPNKKLREVL